ncbi:MAG: hypothetical protein HY390_03675 [Deltaproteobacteria bacterium]|nr:hypothetical protein [Deltaproteobacteria bacterium]
MLKKSFLIGAGCVFITACGGGGGGGGDSSVTQTSPTQETQIVPSELDQEKLQESIIEIQTLSFKDLKKYFPSQTDSLTRDQANILIDKYLTDKGETFTTPEREYLIQKIFGNGLAVGTFFDTTSFFQKHISENIQKKISEMNDLDINNLENFTPLSEDEQTQLVNTLETVSKNLPTQQGILDRNADGVINFKDYLNILKPHFFQTLTPQEIDNLYYYWRYFVDLKNDAVFKSLMWPNQNGIQPPIVIQPLQKTKKRVLVLNFQGQLGLKNISLNEAASFLNLPDIDLNTYDKAIYKTVYLPPNTTAQTADMIIDQVAIFYPDFEIQADPQIIFYIKDVEQNPLNAGALILTPTVHIRFLESQTSGRFLKTPFISKAYAQENILGTNAELTEKQIKSANNIINILLEEGEIKGSEAAVANFKEAMANADNNFVEDTIVEINTAMQEIFSQQGRLMKENSVCETVALKNDEHACTLYKDLSALTKLRSRIVNLYHSLSMDLISAIPELKSLEEKEERMLKNGTTFEDTNYLAITTATTAISAIITVAAIMPKISMLVAEGATKAVIVVAAAKPIFISKMIDQAVALLNFSHDKWAKLFGTKAASGILKLIAVLKAAKVKVQAQGHISTLGGIGAGLGLGSLQNMVDDIHDQMIKAFEKNLSKTNSKAAELRTLIIESTLLREYTKRKLNEIDPKIKEVEGAIQRRREFSVDIRLAHKQEYENFVKTLQHQYETDIEKEKEITFGFEEDLKQAQTEYDKFKSECKMQEFKVDMAHDSVKAACIEMFDADTCSKRIQREDAEIETYTRMGCTNKDAPALKNFESSVKDYQAAESQMRENIKTLGENLQQALIEARKNLDQALAATQINCNTELSESTFSVSKLPVLKAQALWESANETQEIIKNLKIKCKEEAPAEEEQEETTVAPPTSSQPEPDQEITQSLIQNPFNVTFSPKNSCTYASAEFESGGGYFYEDNDQKAVPPLPTAVTYKFLPGGGHECLDCDAWERHPLKILKARNVCKGTLSYPSGGGTYEYAEYLYDGDEYQTIDVSQFGIPALSLQIATEGYIQVPATVSLHGVISIQDTPTDGECYFGYARKKVYKRTYTYGTRTIRCTYESSYIWPSKLKYFQEEFKQ